MVHSDSLYIPPQNEKYMDLNGCGPIKMVAVSIELPLSHSWRDYHHSNLTSYKDIAPVGEDRQPILKSNQLAIVLLRANKKLNDHPEQTEYERVRETDLWC